MPTCSDCGRKLLSTSSYKYHIEHKVCHKEPTTHKCHLCQKIFSTKRMCKYHIDHNVCGREGKPKLMLNANATANHTYGIFACHLLRGCLWGCVSRWRLRGRLLRECLNVVENTFKVDWVELHRYFYSWVLSEVDHWRRFLVTLHQSTVLLNPLALLRCNLLSI